MKIEFPGCSDERVTTPTPPSPPPIPLQTYLWEDVRRERKKGGYPWTHFVKKPFDPDAPQVGKHTHTYST